MDLIWIETLRDKLSSTLIKVFFNPLGFAKEKWRVFVGDFHELPERLHRREKLVGEFFMLLILPSCAEVRETRLESLGASLGVIIETLEFFGEPSHFLWIHDCLCHNEKNWVN